MEPSLTSERTCRVARDRGGVDHARRFAELAVSYCDSEAKEATSMVVTELAENIVKYSEKAGGFFAGTIAIAVSDGAIRIRATNQVASVDDARHVQEALAQIAAAESLMELYRSRLAELFANPGLSRSQLGLLRVACEGGFHLSCSYDESFLTVVAERGSASR
jgi:hypothetical protein